MGGQELRDPDIALIFGVPLGVINEDDRLTGWKLDAIKLALRPAFFDWRDAGLRRGQAGEAEARLAQERLGKNHRESEQKKAAEDEIMRKAGRNGCAATAELSRQEKEFGLVSLPAFLL